MNSWLLQDSPLDPINKLPVVPSRKIHDKRRTLTYPCPIMNTWYHLCNSEELKIGSVVEIKALNQVFALWRKSDGTPVAQDAFCLHLGANLAIGGKVVDDCLECPFHRWKFDSVGLISDIPYMRHDLGHCLPKKQLKTYHCVDWCGLVCVYFHADEKPPEFDLPSFISRSLIDEEWIPHLQWNIGFKTLTPVDWVDQAGDHAHFHTLHADFFFPWTKIVLPKWIFNIFPIGICHRLTTYRGDDSEWKTLVSERVNTEKGNATEEKDSGGQYCVDRHLVFFEDEAGLTWGKEREPIASSMSKTLETFVGPAIMVFHIPFTIGAFKAFVTTTPVEGGSVMRVRTFIDYRTRWSLWKRILAWILTGVSASQLISDIDIMENKIRRDKPMLQVTSKFLIKFQINDPIFPSVPLPLPPPHYPPHLVCFSPYSSFSSALREKLFCYSPSMVHIIA